MLAPFVVAGELLGERDEALVVDVERSRLELLEAKFFEDASEVDDILGGFDGCIRFGFCGAQCDDGLLAAAGIEGACAFAEGEADSCVRLGVIVSEVGGIAPCMQASHCFALSWAFCVVDELEMLGCLKVGRDPTEGLPVSSCCFR